ncbi:MAG: hypothetical protein ACE361_09855 [Aureliella sp.]
MRLLQSTPQFQAESVRRYRQSPWIMVAFPAVLTLVAGGLTWALVVRELPQAFWVSVVALAVTAVMSVFKSVLPAFRGGNWLVELHRDRVFINLQDYRSAASSLAGRGNILELLYSDIESIGQLDHRFSVPDSDGLHTQLVEKYLEIRLRSKEDARSIEVSLDDLAAESKVTAPALRPMSCSIDGKNLRVLWKNRFISIQPGLKKVLGELSQRLPTHDDQCYSVADPGALSPQDFESYVRSLSDNGHKLAAIKLMREKEPQLSLHAARELVG